MSDQEDAAMREVLRTTFPAACALADALLAYMEQAADEHGHVRISWDSRMLRAQTDELTVVVAPERGA